MTIKTAYLVDKPMQVSVLIIALSQLVGCTAVPTTGPNESLSQFSKSVKSLKEDTDESFAGITVASAARFKANLIEELAEGDSYSLDKLDIETDLKTLSVTKVPNFLKIQKLKSEVGQLNSSLLAYVNLLEKLADPEAISSETFDTLATSLNNNVLALTPSIKSEGRKADTGLFSLTAMALTKSYLQSKQSTGLVTAIRSNQSAVQRFAAHLQKSVMIIARAVNIEYLQDSKTLKLNVVKSKSRAEGVDTLIARNQKHFTDLQTLKRLHTNYGRLPLIHAEVADMILTGNRGLPMMMRMLEATSKLSADYKTTLTPAVPVVTPIPVVPNVVVPSS